MKPAEYHYDDKFYKLIIAGSTRAAQYICPWILTIFPDIKSVVDFGCGCGCFLNEFYKFGKTIKGFDSGVAAPKNLVIPADFFEEIDLSQKNYSPVEKYDICLSLEVAEHLPKNAANDFICTLTTAADIVLFSAAMQKQTGVNHINEQPPKYWADIFAQYGYIAYDILRPVFWNIEEIPFWYRQNMILYVNSTKHRQYPLLKNFNNWECYPIIHPQRMNI